MAIQINNATSPLSSQVQLSQTRETAGKEATAKLETALVSQATAAAAAESTEPSSEELEVAVSNINNYVQNIKRSIHFSVSESTGRTIIEVYDSQTDELIREIPSEEMQRISEAIASQMTEGLFVKIDI